MPATTIFRRPMLPGEERRAKALAGSSLSSYAFVLASFVGIGFPVASLLGWLASLGAEEYRDLGRLLGWSLCAVVSLVSMVAFHKHEQVVRAQARSDLAGGEVEELKVETDRAVALETDHSSVDPAVVIALGEGKVLLLCGQWVFSPELFGDTRDAGNEDDPPWWNGLAPPHAFPSTRFTLRRLPTSGVVLSIASEGDYLTPEGPIGVDLAKRSPRPSEILSGTVDEIDQVLAPLRAQAR